MQIKVCLMPRVDDIIDELEATKYITTLDLSRGYCQVPVAVEDTVKMAFVTTSSLYESLGYSPNPHLFVVLET